jgi:DNA polymerase I-like protein with 3'-5' exonuclease and polymerase domains
MIYFQTYAKHKGVTLPRISINAIIDWLQMLPSKSYVGFDLETNGLDAYKNKPLLLALGNSKTQFVIDLAYYQAKKLTEKVSDLDLDIYAIMRELERHIVVGHNLKFDLKFIQVVYKTMPAEIYDTMIVHQKLYQGCNFLWNLDATAKHYINYLEPNFDKSIREQFINTDISSTNFTDAQILYAANDVKFLEDIVKKQLLLADELELTDWLRNVELPLIKVLAKCELKGFKLNVEQIRNNVAETEKKKFKAETKLDEIVRNLRGLYGTDNETLQQPKYNRERQQKPNQATIGLFGEMSEKEFFKSYKRPQLNKIKKAVVNWNSGDEFLKVCAGLQLPAPLQGKAYKDYGYLIPVIDETRGKLDKSIGLKPISKDEVYVSDYSFTGEGWTTDKTALNKYLIDNPDSPLEEFINTYIEYKGYSHELSTFGESLIQKINPVSGRIHTVFRQMNAVNGRLQSGGGNKDRDKINFQNIPRDEKFRTAFSGGEYVDVNSFGIDFTNNDFVYPTKKYSVVTCDLTGAEVTIMCDKANDMQLYEWAVVNDDSHSPMVQNVWRNIFLYRAGLIAEIWKTPKEFEKYTKNDTYITFSGASIEMSNNAEALKWLNLFKTFIVTKKINKPYRQAGKNGTFGGVYGMGAKKAQETYNNTNSELAKIDKNYEPVNVTYDEGAVAIIAQKRTIPKTFAMVEAAVKTALNNGCIVLNQRSKSRIWFYPIAKLLQTLRKDGVDRPTLHWSRDSVTCVETQTTYEMDWKDIIDAQGQARNVPISGTQADIVKEAMVEIDKYITANHLNCHLLSQIHDELVYSCPKDIDGHSDEFKAQGENAFNFAEFVRNTMTETSNKFLNHVTMKASVEVKDTWIK